MKDGEIGVILDTVVILTISRPVIACSMDMEYGVPPVSSSYPQYSKLCRMIKMSMLVSEEQISASPSISIISVYVAVDTFH